MVSWPFTNFTSVERFSLLERRGDKGWPRPIWGTTTFLATIISSSRTFYDFLLLFAEFHFFGRPPFHNFLGEFVKAFLPFKVWLKLQKRNIFEKTNIQLNFWRLVFTYFHPRWRPHEASSLSRCQLGFSRFSLLFWCFTKGEKASNSSCRPENMAIIGANSFEIRKAYGTQKQVEHELWKGQSAWWKIAPLKSNCQSLQLSELQTLKKHIWGGISATFLLYLSERRFNEIAFPTHIVSPSSSTS